MDSFVSNKLRSNCYTSVSELYDYMKTIYKINVDNIQLYGIPHEVLQNLISLHNCYDSFVCYSDGVENNMIRFSPLTHIREIKALHLGRQWPLRNGRNIDEKNANTIGFRNTHRRVCPIKYTQWGAFKYYCTVLFTKCDHYNKMYLNSSKSLWYNIYYWKVKNVNWNYVRTNMQCICKAKEWMNSTKFCTYRAR